MRRRRGERFSDHVRTRSKTFRDVLVFSNSCSAMVYVTIRDQFFHYRFITCPSVRHTPAVTAVLARIHVGCSIECEIIYTRLLLPSSDTNVTVDVQTSAINVVRTRCGSASSRISLRHLAKIACTIRSYSTSRIRAIECVYGLK
jgi:hypothetical protein